MLWVEFFCVWAERDPGAFTYCARKTNALRRQNLPRAFVTSKMLSYTQLFWTEKPVTSCSTSLVTLTWSRSHLQGKKKKKGKKYQLSCIYLLDKCKGFLPFHVWILWKQNPFFFLIYSRHIVHLSLSWVDVGTVWPSLFMWTVCVRCACACMLVCFTKTVRMVTLSVSWNA